MTLALTSFLAAVTWLAISTASLQWAIARRRWFLWGLSVSSFYMGGFTTIQALADYARLSNPDPIMESVFDHIMEFLLSNPTMFQIYLLMKIVFGISIIAFAFRIRPTESPDQPPLPKPE